MDAEMVARSWTQVDHQGEKEEEEMEMETEKFYDQPGPCESEEEGKGMLLRFLRGLQPVSYVYWDD